MRDPAFATGESYAHHPRHATTPICHRMSPPLRNRSRHDRGSTYARRSISMTAYCTFSGQHPIPLPSREPRSPEHPQTAAGKLSEKRRISAEISLASATAVEYITKTVVLYYTTAFIQGLVISSQARSNRWTSGRHVRQRTTDWTRAESDVRKRMALGVRAGGLARESGGGGGRPCSEIPRCAADAVVHPARKMCIGLHTC